MIIGSILTLKKNSMRIGLVGEAPNDTQSIKNLMEKNYNSGFEFFFMLDRINGSKLDSQKTKRFLRIEYETKSPDLIIFIRDLDSILPNKLKLNGRKLYFTNSNRVVDKNGIYLLHIYEIEALILSDIEVFNEIYNSKLSLVKNPMLIEEPKEYLREKESKYNESHNPDIFKKVRFEKALECDYFNQFILKFNSIVELHKQ